MDDLVPHYISVHGYRVSEYTLDGVQFAEIDKEGRFSERANQITRRGVLMAPSGKS